jgi:succinate-acetate transporter protein
LRRRCTDPYRFARQIDEERAWQPLRRTSLALLNQPRPRLRRLQPAIPRYSGFRSSWSGRSHFVLGVFHNWLLIQAANVNKSIALFLISWTIVMAGLTVATLRLPVSYTAVIALVVLALILRTIGVLNTDSTMNKAAGWVVFLFAALGMYLFLHSADTATGGSGLPLGQPLRKGSSEN